MEEADGVLIGTRRIRACPLCERRARRVVGLAQLQLGSWRRVLQLRHKLRSALDRSNWCWRDQKQSGDQR